MLELRQLSYRYPHADKPALADVSLAVPKGCVLGLLGPNGAGKTTLISHLSGTLAVQSGEIRIDGEPLKAVRAKTPTRIAVAPQEHAFYPMLTVAENPRCLLRPAGSWARAGSSASRHARSSRNWSSFRTCAPSGCRAASSAGSTWPSPCCPNPS